MIQQIDANTFKADNGRGTSWTLIRTKWDWTVYAENASTRAYGCLPKCFDTLEQVEGKYKAFRGVSALIN